MLQNLIKISCCFENNNKNAIHNCSFHCSGFKKSIVHFEKLFSMHGCTLNNRYPFFTVKSEKYFSFEITQMERKMYVSINNYSLPSS